MSPLLRFWTSRPRRSAARRGQNWFRPQLDSLEPRVVPRAAMWLDFGFSLPGGSITVSGTDMRNDSINGPQRFGNGHTLISLTGTVQTQGIDLNGDGRSDQDDANILASRVMSTARRMLEPFDIALFQGNAASLNEVGDIMRGPDTHD